MKKLTAALLLLNMVTNCPAQQEFFKSNNSFSPEQLKVFYSSITLKDSVILFNAIDYKLYAFHTGSRKFAWERSMNWKSDVPPFFVEENIWATGDGATVQLNPQTGEKIKDLPFARLETQPFARNGIYYGTAIFDGGSLYAYDAGKDTVLWTRFLAHGCSVTPYYQAGKIIANAEGNNWLEVNYDGKLTDPSCENPDIRFPSELSCVRQYAVITHDGRELSGAIAQEMADHYDYDPRVTYVGKHTLLLNAGKLYVIGDKSKVKSTIELESLLGEVETYSNATPVILKAEDKTAWILYNNHLVEYEFIEKKVKTSFDLTRWRPHQAILQHKQLWLISRADGQLYGINL